jgi:SSS family solute:Na+ symporter
LVSLIVMLTPSQAKFWGNPTIPATLAGLIAQVAVSWLTPPRHRSFEDVAQAMKSERQEIEGALPEGLSESQTHQTNAPATSTAQ